MSDVTVTDLRVDYGKTAALKGVSFVAHDGEFVSLLGPSGCGKTTTLMSLAGMIQPTSGRIDCGGRVLFDAASGSVLPAEKRNFGVVFQSYAVWPHMTVEQNVAFPLKLRKFSRERIKETTAEALDLVDMKPYWQRLPHELSGGQQQRVALARALVYSPDMLLLDEPLSNLDAKLRADARYWLKHLQGQVGITTILVTHDQDEALSLSDQVIVMNAGGIEQSGSPEEVYRRPANPFVADFVGASNLLDSVVLDHDESAAVARVCLTAGAGVLAVEAHGNLVVGDTVRVSVRAEEIGLRMPVNANADTNASVVDAEITARTFLGPRYRYSVAVGGISIIVLDPASWPMGPVQLVIPRSATWAFPNQSVATETETAPAQQVPSLAVSAKRT